MLIFGYRRVTIFPLSPSSQMAELLTRDPRLRTEVEDAWGFFHSDPRGSSGWGEGARGSEDVGPGTDRPQGLSSLHLDFLNCSVLGDSEILAGSCLPLEPLPSSIKDCNGRSIDPGFCFQEATCPSLLTPASLAPNRILLCSGLSTGSSHLAGSLNQQRCPAPGLSELQMLFSPVEQKPLSLLPHALEFGVFFTPGSTQNRPQPPTPHPLSHTHPFRFTYRLGLV